MGAVPGRWGGGLRPSAVDPAGRLLSFLSSLWAMSSCGEQTGADGLTIRRDGEEQVQDRGPRRRP
ncbi:hypothetical protein EYF80_066241 [Liparis tanakae]|uniref:Uncharacterized protein n=1 Tax=Liparis tanakae TaxID=230148 RepID=A0A4Z2E4G9_9TELE|nr:hypothetical protein EYF80_066241 [Liparis tanakae]